MFNYNLLTNIPGFSHAELLLLVNCKSGGTPANPNPHLGANIGGVLAPRCGLGLRCVPSLLQLTSTLQMGTNENVFTSVVATSYTKL